jgi:hypothetical protein
MMNHRTGLDTLILPNHIEVLAIVSFIMAYLGI